MSEPRPFFTIILSTYNRARIILRALESVIQQTEQSWELLIIDDGSTDDTFDLIRPYLTRDLRMRYHYGVNRGLAEVRNLGISMAAGEYITFLDSDDEYLPEHLATRRKILMHERVDLLHGGLEVVGDQFVADRHQPSRLINISDCSVGGTFFFRDDLIEKVGSFRTMYGDDNDFFERAVNAGARILKTDLPTYRYYRGESDSLCQLQSPTT